VWRGKPRVPTANPKELTDIRESVDSPIDERSLRLIWCGLIGLFRPRAALEAEILVLRHQLNVLRRKSPKRVTLSSIDRLLLVGLYRLAPGVLDALKIIRPETLMRWHRAGFRAYWRWKSRPRGGRPTTPGDIRHLIRDPYGLFVADVP
jgi:hypothetical protein